MGSQGFEPQTEDYLISRPEIRVSQTSLWVTITWELVKNAGAQVLPLETLTPEWGPGICILNQHLRCF